MTVFQAYAHYYDLFYRDKNYAGEALYVDGLIRDRRPGAKTILDLGCGTGGHALEMARLGYEVHGVDLSQAMLHAAQAHLCRVPHPERGRIRFSQGDIRHLRLACSFDIVVSLFHVLSYQTTEADLRETMETAQAHLEEGGIFIFDCWYGPGVLKDPPVRRIQDFPDGDRTVFRIADPLTLPEQNLVEVSYHIIEKGLHGRIEREIHEVHRMRYLFTSEIDRLARQSSLQVVGAFEWTTDRPPSPDNWNACFVVRK
jgi:SAM-dependent methyltransferase